MARARDAGYNLFLAGDGAIQISCDETTTGARLREVAAALLGRAPAEVELAADPADAPGTPGALPAELRRSGEFLTHPVFHSHRSETSMMRYLRRLADSDIALDRSMIPLGSCTMKLNAAAEMEPITWPEFASLHPFAPPEQAAGYLELISGLEAALAAITGYDAVSLQPNAGSQGELAGLLAIRAYHRSRQEPDRTVCLIPESAHGTNAASAVMAGMRVVVVECGADGAIDLDDLRAKMDAHAGQVAAIMVTYPSTHGVFEETVGQVCEAVHAAGGQVYIDGANLNALVGLASPVSFGADVSHLNLHKTFCIPHGGGGPGVGPVAVRSHLAEFLPGHDAAADPGHVGPVAGAPYGSAGILPISWAYIAMMGADGLRRATQVAVLSANYVAQRLAPHYPVLYTGRAGLVAHECVIDLRPITARTGITSEDVAKRLIDYGFHAPTMSFPVAGTLMIEPTESEDTGRAGPVLRGHDRHPAGDRAGRRGGVRPRRQPAEERPAHRRDADRGGVEALLRPRRGRLPGRPAPPGQVLAPGPAHRPGLRRPAPDVRLPAPGGLRLTRARNAAAHRRPPGSRSDSARTSPASSALYIWNDFLIRSLAHAGEAGNVRGVVPDERAMGKDGDVRRIEHARRHRSAGPTRRQQTAARPGLDP